MKTKTKTKYGTYEYEYLRLILTDSGIINFAKEDAERLGYTGRGALTAYVTALVERRKSEASLEKRK